MTEPMLPSSVNRAGSFPEGTTEVQGPPLILAPNFNRMPDELKGMRNWVVWKYLPPSPRARVTRETIVNAAIFGPLRSGCCASRPRSSQRSPGRSIEARLTPLRIRLTLVTCERAVLDVDYPVGKFEQSRIMSHHQNGATSLFGDRRENRHGCLPIG